MKNSRTGCWFARLQEEYVNRVPWARNMGLEVHEIKENKNLPQPGTKEHLKYILWTEQSEREPRKHFTSTLHRTGSMFSLPVTFDMNNTIHTKPWSRSSLKWALLTYWSSCVWLFLSFFLNLILLFYGFFQGSRIYCRTRNSLWLCLS